MPIESPHGPSLLADHAALMTTLAICVERLLDLGIEDVVRFSQSDYDNIAYKQLLEGYDSSTGEIILKIDHTKRELS